MHADLHGEAERRERKAESQSLAEAGEADSSEAVAGGKMALQGGQGVTEGQAIGKGEPRATNRKGIAEATYLDLLKRGPVNRRLLSPRRGHTQESRHEDCRDRRQRARWRPVRQNANTCLGVYLCA
jgi:hypothetical protein